MSGRHAEKGHKLGLALSGGGFRASFFHLGVLRRLAELGLLRQVAVLSTVSGGSIVAALYYLHLKRAMAAKSRLENEDYEHLVEQVIEEFRDGVTHNLRARLMLNPLDVLRRILQGRSLSSRMGRLYTKYLFGKALEKLPNHWEGLKREQVRRRGLPLREMEIRLQDPQRDHELQADFENYNLDPAHDCVPKFILNATCLNTACPFRFSSVEVGDPLLGYLRFDEVEVVGWYKRLLKSMPPTLLTPEGLCELVHQARLQETKDFVVPEPALRWPDHLLWFHACRLDAADKFGQNDLYVRARKHFTEARKAYGRSGGEILRVLLNYWDVSCKLMSPHLSRFAELRRAKESAWWLQQMKVGTHERRGGRRREAWLEEFWEAIETIDPALKKTLWKACGQDNKELQGFFLNLYYLRSAVAFAEQAAEAISKLTLSDAVTASANFPPFFEPFFVRGLYDSRESVKRLALTDGGVYDNQGIDALLEEECTAIIASDAGGLLGIQEGPSGSRLHMMPRIAGALMANVRNAQLYRLQEEGRVSKGIERLSPDPDHLHERYRLKNAAFFHMTFNPNDASAHANGAVELPEHPLAPAIARLRTDLDCFSQAEVEALIYQGYRLADRFVRKGMIGWPGLLTGAPQDPIGPGNRYVEQLREVREKGLEHLDKQYQAVLKAGNWRFGRWLRTGFLRVFSDTRSPIHEQVARWGAPSYRTVACSALGWLAIMKMTSPWCRSPKRGPVVGPVLRGANRAGKGLGLLFLLPLAVVPVGAVLSAITVAVTPITRRLGRRRPIQR